MYNICMHYFSPGQAVAIDKNVVDGKVRNPMRQYLQINTTQGLEQKTG